MTRRALNDDAFARAMADVTPLKADSARTRPRARISLAAPGQTPHMRPCQRTGKCSINADQPTNRRSDSLAYRDQGGVIWSPRWEIRQADVSGPPARVAAARRRSSGGSLLRAPAWCVRGYRRRWHGHAPAFRRHINQCPTELRDPTCGFSATNPSPSTVYLAAMTWSPDWYTSSRPFRNQRRAVPPLFEIRHLRPGPDDGGGNARTYTSGCPVSFD